MNKAQVIGNITQDIEMKQTPNWQNVVSTSIATNENYTDKEGNKQQKVEFHNIVAWGKTAELMNNYLGKGSKIYAEWKLQTRNWEKEWVKFYRTEIIVQNIEFLSKKPETAEPKPETTPKPHPADEISIEDIPF